MKMNENRWKCKNKLRKIIFKYMIAKDQPIQEEKNLNPRPSYRVRTNKLHYVCHGNSELFDNLLISQLELKRAGPQPV